MKKISVIFFIIFVAMSAFARKDNFDTGWTFAFGDASSPADDFGCGTEYFNYLTKAASIHNEGPYSPKFDPEKWGKTWTPVDLPHDWVVDLPFAPEASHSHGYKSVGHKFPQTSVGWYRKSFAVPAEAFGKHVSLQFDGVFRDSRVWVNGFYLGNEPSGYLPQIYNISEYLNYGGDNVVTVRVDASLEEGWFYEGAGIYRHVWLNITDPVHIADFGTFAQLKLDDSLDKAVIDIHTEVTNDGRKRSAFTLAYRLTDADGNIVASTTDNGATLLPCATHSAAASLTVASPKLWSPDSPYLYTLHTDVMVDGSVVDTSATPVGVRSARFDKDKGFILNGVPLKLKGVNMHQDHAGVGTAIPDSLQVYRLKRLKEIGVNAYRCSHNPPTPELLDACDRLGILVIDENRLLGTSPYQLTQLQRMIKRDRNHPSVILWSVGNEEWGVEWNDYGTRIVETMRDYCHLLDPTRPMTVASSSGPTVLVPADVAGYNYIMQNPVEEHRAKYPQRCAVGTEETSGCGSRGIYFDDADNGRMKAINRAPAGADSCINCIERGWQFYADRPWLGGLFYWTGFDYRGEPNPLSFPATGSEFGIFDYCGFPKDEAFYLKSWWTDTPVLHILPHWNLKGHEGERVSIWAYSNCDEVQLIVNGKKLGRKKMPVNGHLEWDAVYAPGYLHAIGYKNGKKIIERRIDTTGQPANITAVTNKTTLAAGNSDVLVCDISITDAKGREVPDACIALNASVSHGLRILGYGNGDPAFQAVERPTERDAKSLEICTFNGKAQILIQAPSSPRRTSPSDTDATHTLSISAPGLSPFSLSFSVSD